MKIGNIVSQTPVNVGKEFNVVDSMDNIIHGLPTLIVGYGIVKENYGPDQDFMKRQIDGVFWTFTKEEHRKYHVIDVDRFIDYSFDFLVDKIKYIFVDPIQFKRKKIKKIIKKIKSIDKVITYIDDKDMAYIYGDNLIFGVDLNLLRFLGINDNKIKSRLKTNSKAFLGGNEILIEYKNYMERLGDQAKYIPFLYSISRYE